MKKETTLLLFLIVFLTTLQFTHASIKPDSPDFYDSQIITGPSGTSFGMYTKNIGDFNGDGFDDFAISASSEDNFNGAVRIYFGGEQADLEPDIILRGSNQEGLGANFANAGDFNGDGFDDFIVSTKSYPPAVKLFYGGPNYDLYEDVTFSDDYVSASFGAYMSRLGDINGDGLSDLIIMNSSLNIYLGRSEQGYDIHPDFLLNGYGSKFCFAGDLNADGFDDVVTANASSGLLYIFKGGEYFDVTYDAFMNGGNYTGFGTSLSGGDINNDGINDLIIGAPSYSNNEMNNFGRVYGVLGSTDLFENTDPFGLPSSFFIEGTNAGERFGHSVSVINDMNGDGFNEIAVGENYNFTSEYINAVKIYNGGNRIEKAPSYIFNPREKGSLAYFHVASIDFDNDGYGEVLAGDHSNDRVYLFDNSPNSNLLFTDLDLVVPVEAYGHFNGDFNGDRYNDLLSYYYGLFINNKGSFNSESGNFVSGEYVGDINGDGFDDIVRTEYVGGTAWIYWGNNNEDFAPEVLYQVPDTLGISLWGNGDFNGDGLSDLVFKSFQGGLFGGSTDGKFLVFLGGEYLSSEPDMIIGNSNYSASYCKIGDFNGDNFDDLMASRYEISTETFTNNIFYGSDAGLFTAGYLPTEFNFNLCEPADLNGDGFDDLAYGFDDNIYLMFGHAEEDYETFDYVQIPASYTKADVNSDGIDDAIFSNNTISYGGVNFPNNGYSYFPLAYDYWSTGDINNDGLVDLGFSKPTQDGSYIVGIVFNTQQNKAPRIVSVKDVPADQGGFVTLSWFKSGLDGGKVTSYQIERSIAPMGNGFAWEVINTIPASHFNYYSYTAPTLNDETPENTGNTYFRVTALTENEDVYYRSNIMYGHSTDNLAPLAPSGLNAVASSNGVKVSWQLNSEEDLKEYNIYRSVSEEVSFDTLDVYAVVSDSVFVDESPLAESYYYFVRAVDIHENIGNSSSVLYNLTGVEEDSNLPTEYRLSQNYPNPFNPTTTINYSIPLQRASLRVPTQSGRGNLSQGQQQIASSQAPRNDVVNVTLKVYDILGREVATLVNQKQAPGNYSVQFDASKLSSGIYFYKLQSGSFVVTKKMILLR